MRPFWHPLSTLLIADPPSYATPTLLRMLLRSGRRLRLIYAGDRMWPAVKHGQEITVDPIDGPAGSGNPRSEGVRSGAVVVGCPDGIPDLLRIESVEGNRVRLGADADPGTSLTIHAGELMALARLPCTVSRRFQRVARRLALELAESWTGRHDRASDAAQTILAKYDAQAPFYTRVEGQELEPALLERVRQRFPVAGRMFVIGSGTGRECFALARDGWRVKGVDFAPAMVELATREASRRGLAVEFQLADVRELHLPERSLDGVLFTYDVYSFIPDSAARVAALRRMRSWLRPGGAVFLSARRVRTAYDRWILTLQWLSRRRMGTVEWGASHTRWIAIDGTLHRSSIRVFDDRKLRRETAAAGFESGRWHGGHCELVPEVRLTERPATMRRV